MIGKLFFSPQKEKNRVKLVNEWKPWMDNWPEECKLKLQEYSNLLVTKEVQNLTKT